MSETETIYISNDAESEDNQGLSTMTAMSITIAVFALLLVMIYGLTKCASIIAKNKNVIQAIVKRNKVEPYERKTNIYGTYNKTKISTEDDEYEFDSDSFEDDERYAVIRDSQVLSTIVATDGLGDICRPHDECPQYDTKGYNHLNIMGPRHTPGSQKPFVSNYSDAVIGKKLFTFDE